MSFGVLFGLRKKVTIKAVVWGSITLTVICLEVFGFFCYKKYLSVDLVLTKDYRSEVFVWRK